GCNGAGRPWHTDALCKLTVCNGRSRRNFAQRLPYATLKSRAANVERQVKLVACRFLRHDLSPSTELTLSYKLMTTRTLRLFLWNLGRGWPRFAMSALGHLQTSASRSGMSALPPKADMFGGEIDVCFVPIADINAA